MINHVWVVTKHADCSINPVGIWCQNDVVSTSMRRNHVASTLIRRPSRGHWKIYVISDVCKI